MAAGLFMASALALLATASATCSTSSIGTRSAVAVVASDGTVPAGAYIVEVPNPCSGGMYEVGAKAVACSDAGYVNVVAKGLQRFYVYSDYGASLIVTGYCYTASDGHHRGHHHHHS